MTKKAIILIIILIAGGAVFYVFQEGKKSAAVVGGEAISSARLDKNFRAALQYYKIADQTYQVENVDLSSEPFLRELRRSVLDGLITDTVIIRELEKAYGGEELARRVEANVEAAKKEGDVAQAAAQIYGMSIDEFTEEVLRPQARYEIMEEYLASEKMDANPWLEERLKKAEVSVSEEGFGWNGKEVTVK